MKQKAESYEGAQSKTLKRYKKDLFNFSKRPFKESSLADIFKSINHSQIVYLGDFHTFDENTRNLERIIKVLAKNKEKFILGIEFINFVHKNKIIDYLNHHITELEFLEDIDYKDSWRFPWNHYQVLFELAKENNFEILPLNSTGSLSERDAFAANLIGESLKKNSDTKFLILFGEMHIAPDKLPQKVNEIFGKTINQLIIHQNLDEIFWKSKEELVINKTLTEPPQIIKFNNNEYSIQTSPPWIKYESQIYWYEHLLEDPNFDIHEYIMETGFKVFHGGIQENFLFILKEILRILNYTDYSNDELEDFNLLDHTNIDFIIEKIDRYKTKGLRTHLKKLLISGAPFKLPYQNNFYCSSYSINRLSFLAGIKIQEIITSKFTRSERTILNGGETEIFFYYLQQNLMAYFSSKIINPFRKCDLYCDLKEQYNNPKAPLDQIKSLELLFLITDNEIFNKELIIGLPISRIFSVAKLLGYLMADSYYEHFFKTSYLNSKEILTEIFNFNFSIDSYQNLKIKLLDNQDYKNHKKRFF